MVIRTSVFPIRVKYRDKQPWELIVEVQNEDDKQKDVSVAIQLPDQVSFSTVGLTDRFERQVEKFKPKGTIQLKMPIHQSNSVEVGYFTGKVTVEEHPHGFEYQGKKVRKEIPFRIVE